MDVSYPQIFASGYIFLSEIRKSTLVELCRLELDKSKDWPLGIEGDKWWRGGENGCNILNIESLKIRPRFKVEFGSDYFGHCDKYSLIVI